MVAARRLLEILFSHCVCETCAGDSTRESQSYQRLQFTANAKEFKSFMAVVVCVCERAHATPKCVLNGTGACRYNIVLQRPILMFSRERCLLFPRETRKTHWNFRHSFGSMLPLHCVRLLPIVGGVFTVHMNADCYSKSHHFIRIFIVQSLTYRSPSNGGFQVIDIDGNDAQPLRTEWYFAFMWMGVTNTCQRT